METFLNSSKKNLTILDQLKQVHVVLGNEACDLDSVVSTLVTAYLFQNLNLAFGIIVFPVINVPREDLRIRTEVTYFLTKLNIPLDLLICKDEFDFERLHNDGNLSVILVDHNVLAPSDSFLEMSVIRIIDHHVQENIVKDKYDVTIELVGSCATLVAEKVFEKLPDILDTQIAMLLYGTIIFDTVCLNENAKRVTSKDMEIASKLESLLKDVNKEEIFQEIKKAKFDVSDLTFDELLRKDLKVISNNTINIAISSLPMLLQSVKTSENIESTVNHFCSKFQYNAVVMMGINIKTETEIKRDIGIYSPLSDLQQQIIEFLKNYDDPNLELEELEFPFPLFNQKNSSASRKFILPILNRFLQHQIASVSSSLFVSYPLCQVGNIENSDDLSDFDPLSAENADSNLGSPRYGSGSTNLIGRLGVSGEPLSSQSSSAQNSCPYTPQNSFVEDSFDLDDSLVKQTESLPSFNSREMIEKIEHKRGKLRGYDKDTDVSSIRAIPFTPKNSFSDSSFESYVPQQILAMDSDSLIEKVKKKKASLVGGDEFLTSFEDAYETQADKTVNDKSSEVKCTEKTSIDNESLQDGQECKLSLGQNSPLIPVITMTQLDKTEIIDH
ncbi:exopolyphosphatase PRUNE1 [Centruroides vittatus]|uniref:exopolyphosphatase PRUNE1 n=1 Tax=Centruroides vittatus TaxID=120091 RepID=UPI00350F93AB